ncbi:MBL fold metallo-hydrolase, partial [Staphylococcus aureus]
RIYGNTYLVGFRKMNVALIDTGAGLILIDAALPQSVAAVEANIRTLGFKLRDVKFILSTEPHYDHAGGLAALARDSGATIIASAP